MAQKFLNGVHISGNATFNGTQTIFNPDGNSQAKILNVGTDAIALYASSGDGLYLGGGGTTNLYLDASTNATFAGDVIIDDGVGRITLSSVSGENRIQSTTTGFSAYEKLAFTADDYEFKLGNATFAGKVITTEVESTSTLLLDATGDITIDAGGGDIILSDDAAIFGTISSSGGMQIRSRVNNADMFLRGVDNGTEFNALTLDMSEGGNATFSGEITLNGTDGHINLDGNNAAIFDNSNNNNAYYIRNGGSNSATLQIGTGSPGSNIKLTLDGSGNATFAGGLSVTGSTNLAGLTASSLTTPTIQLQGDLKILNKSQTAYIALATKDTSGSEVVYNLSNLGSGSFAGALAIGPGTTGSPYDATTFLHVKGTTRSIVQQSSTADAYYMFGDAAANNAAWVGYSHTAGNLEIHAQTSVTIDKNTTITGNIAASNFSGSSSGANTGDQTLPTASSLGAVTLTGSQTISGAKTFTTGIVGSQIGLGGNTSYHLTQHSNGQLKVQTQYGLAEMGPGNSSYNHFGTDRPTNYFNKSLTVDTGIVTSYDENLILRRSSNASHQLTISTNGGVFTGSLSASNLSGTNTGDQTLPTLSSLGAALDSAVVHKAGAETITGVKLFQSNVNSGGFVTQKNVNAGNQAYTSKLWQSDVGQAEIWRNSSTRTQTGGAVQSFNIYNSLDTNIWSGASRTLHLDSSQNAFFANSVDLEGTFKWAKNQASSYTYSAADANGMYIERVSTAGDGNTKADIRLQARNNNVGGYTALSIKGSDGSINLTAANTTISGNLTVNGTQTILNTATVEVEDNILQLNTTQASPDTATAATSGISIYRGNGIAQASLIFDDADDYWDLTNNLKVAGNIHTPGDIHIDDGSSSAHQTSDKLRFGHTSWNNNIGIEAYWMRLGCNQNEGFKFVDSVGTIVLQLQGNNSTAGNGAKSATFAGSVNVRLGGLIDYKAVTSASTTTVVASISGSTYAAVFFDYVVYKSANIRAGVVTACSDGTNVSFSETSTTDLGDTSDVTLSVALNGSNFELRATTTSSTWNVKSLIRAI